MNRLADLRAFLLWATVGAVVNGVSAQGSADLDYVSKEIEAYRSLPKFVAPGPAFDARTSMKGKSILSLPVSSANPFTSVIEQGFAEVSKDVGFKFMEWKNQAQIPQWVNGMSEAVSEKFDLVDLLGGTDPRVLKPQIETVTKAGIKVVSSHYSGFQQEIPSYVTANIPIDYDKAGRLLADWAILKTQGKPNVLVITSDEVYSTAAMVNGLKDEFATKCPGSKTKFVNAPVPDWSSKIQPAVQSAIQADPELNYIIPIYDSMSQFVVPAITLTGAKDRVKIATFNGTPFVIGFVQEGKVEMDIGENLDWIARAIMDAEMRLVCGLEPVKDPHIPFYIFDARNAADAGKPPKPSTGYGSEYIDDYRRLWGLEK
jgi:ribose transport system substrate-binding protein